MLRKTVVITGAGGSVGLSLVKEFVRDSRCIVHAIERSEPGCVPLLDLSRMHDNIKIFPADVRDDAMMDMALDGAETLIHCAAMKRVDIGNIAPEELANQNVTSFVAIARRAKLRKVRKFLFCSTDKSTNPTSVMGASKLLLERIAHFASNERTRFAAVRFGNILGSTGSMIPRMICHSVRDRKIQLTDPRMTRYVMTNDQAVGLIRFALKNMKGGEIYCPILPTVSIQHVVETVREIIATERGHAVRVEQIGNRFEENIHETMMTSEECHFAQASGDVICISGTRTMRALPEPLRRKILSSSTDVIDKKKTHELIKNSVMTSLKNV